MFAIVTKYHGPTDASGSRIRASMHGLKAAYRAAVVSYEPGTSAEENHEQGFRALVAKLGPGHRFWASWSLAADTRVWVPVLVPFRDRRVLRGSNVVEVEP